MANLGGAAAGAAAIVNINTMEEYLEGTIGVSNQGMRNKLVTNGFTDLDALVRMKESDVETACHAIRKTTGPAASREVSMVIQKRLEMLVSYVHYSYITNRTLDYNSAELDQLQSVSTWMDQLGSDPDEETVQVYRDNLNKRVWFESINTFLASKKGSSGMPIAYLTRESRNPPAVDPGFGLPNFHLDLARRGRIDAPGGASSTFYAADNRTLYQLLQRKCVGTTAGNTIRQFQRTMDGRSAYLRLHRQVYGEDARALLLEKAQNKLDKLRFDNRSKNFTFDTFIDRMRECFIDMGPNDQMTETSKVSKLMAAWQVPSLLHLNAIVQSNPQCKHDFEATVTFLSGPHGSHGHCLKHD